VHAPGTVLQNHSDWQGSTLTDSIPILTYHRVHPDHETTVPDDQGRVNLGEFRRQMEYLVAQGVKTVTHHDLAGWLHGGEALPDRPVAIDFDDNRLNIFENAFPILQEHGFRATVFTVTDLADRKPLPAMDIYPAMTWEHLEQLRDAGWCIAPHTRRHLFLTGPQKGVRDLDEVRDEMAGSLERVRTVMGIDAPYFAYPAGFWDEDVEAVAKTLFKTARHWQNSAAGDIPFVRRDTDPYRLVGINVALSMGFDRFRSIIDGAGE
jgi:peptidoglycan/xylan/chitin deacetylase (PgdA/CDA1 family)